MNIDDQRWDRLETRLDRIEGSLSELREDFAAHKATSLANASKILEIDVETKLELEKSDSETRLELEKIRAGQRRVGYLAATSMIAVVGWLLRTVIVAAL